MANYKNQITKAMKSLGTYKQEFDPAILRLAQMRDDYDKANELAGEGLSRYVTDNDGKLIRNPLYITVENLRKEISSLESLLGLNLAGLKKIKQKEEAPKQSKLDAVLNEIKGVGG